MAKDNLVMFSHEFDGIEHLIVKDKFGIDRDFIRPNNIMVISENNTYPVKDCKEVDVQLPEQKAVKLQIAENGEFTPDTYSGEYYDEVTVQMATELTDEEITITENGIYKPTTNKMFSSVTVDVDCTMYGYDDYGNPVSPYIDPVTQKLELEPLPEYITVVLNPTKDEYVSGEEIDYKGLLVKICKKDGSAWRNENYPLGLIPFNELILTEIKADITKTDKKGKKTLDGVSVEVANGYYIEQFWRGNLNRAATVTCPSGVLIINPPLGGTWIAISDIYDTAVHYVNSQEGVYRYSEKERGQQGFNEVNRELGISKTTGKPMYYCDPRGYSWSDMGEYDITVDPELKKTTGIDNLTAADIALHGAGYNYGMQTIPVAWARPGDKKVLKADFGIIVNPETIQTETNN